MSGNDVKKGKNSIDLRKCGVYSKDIWIIRPALNLYFPEKHSHYVIDYSWKNALLTESRVGRAINGEVSSRFFEFTIFQWFSDSHLRSRYILESTSSQVDFKPFVSPEILKFNVSFFLLFLFRIVWILIFFILII